MATDTRRRPQQLRSRANYDAILGAAADLVVESGIDELTTTRVAERAGVAVGTVYQYFKSVDAIADCLAQQCADEFAERLSETLSVRPINRKLDAATSALDAFVDYYRSSALLQALRPTTPNAPNGPNGTDAWTSRSAATMGGAGRRILEVITDAIISRNLGTAEDEAFRLELEVQWAIAQALVPLAFQRSPQGDPIVLGHLRRLFDLDVTGTGTRTSK